MLVKFEYPYHHIFILDWS